MVDLRAKAQAFLQQYYTETSQEGFSTRWKAVAHELDTTGSYTHTPDELTFGAKVAWRNSNRCVGRLYWKTLKVRDMRHLTTPDEIAASLLEHIDYATNGGKIRSTISIFRQQQAPQQIRIWNHQLIRYAGYRQPDGTILGDPSEADFTAQVQALGWRGAGTPYDVLPLVIQVDEGAPQWYEIPRPLVMEVPITHPRLDFSSLNLRWYGVPIISGMALEIGGIVYTAAPFNGFYMVNEVATRNFGDTDRLNKLPEVAALMGLDTDRRGNFWKDRALVELNEAVLHSYAQAGITMIDHHAATDQFMEFVRLEQAQGRSVTADWAWVTPPMSGSATRVFHTEWQNEVRSPNYYYQPSSWQQVPSPASPAAGQCPFHLAHRTTQQQA